MSHRDYKSDTTYNAGLPTFSEADLREIYRKAGVDFETGLPVEKITSGKVALCAGNVSAGVLSVNAPIWTFMAAARKCNCMSCQGVMQNIRDAAAYHKTGEKDGYIRMVAMANIQYYISRLRSIVLSAHIQHNSQ